MDTTCKNCKHDAGDHHYKTNKCPVGVTIYEPDDSVSSVIHTQSQTIERLADALEFALAAGDVSGSKEKEWRKYSLKRWPQRWTMLDIQKAEAAARALLAEIRGAK